MILALLFEEFTDFMWSTLRHGLLLLLLSLPHGSPLVVVDEESILMQPFDLAVSFLAVVCRNSSGSMLFVWTKRSPLGTPLVKKARVALLVV